MLLGNVAPRVVMSEGPSFEAEQQKLEPKAESEALARDDKPDSPDSEPAVNLVDLTVDKAAATTVERKKQDEKYYNDKPVFQDEGGGTIGGFNVPGWGGGVKVTGRGGLKTGLGKDPGAGGAGSGFGASRGEGNRRAMLASHGGTPDTEKAVAHALHWLMRHQCYEGNWSFDKYKSQCKDASCSGAGSATADAGATGLALLCYLAAGQTHKARCPYRMNVERGLIWLTRHQEPDGNLAKGCVSPMYSHAMATIALCEAFGLSGDRNVATAAQAAVNFILAAQNKNDNGWRYNPGDPGDTSVVGWQIMALKSAQMVGLNVGGSGGTGSAFELAGKWLDLVKTGPNDSQFQYQPGTGATPAMSAAGLLCRQYLHAKRNDPMMIDGVKYLLNNPPDVKMHNAYYWYYATQVVYNYNGYDWDTWNRDAEGAPQHANEKQDLRRRQLGSGESRQGPVGASRRPAHAHGTILSDARSLLPHPAAV